jgi:hypothetical protein
MIQMGASSAKKIRNGTLRQREALARGRPAVRREQAEAECGTSPTLFGAALGALLRSSSFMA